MKTKVSLEYLLVVGIFLLASLLFFYFYYTHFLLSEDTTRVAVASGIIQMSQDAYDAIVSEATKKGPVVQTAVIAAIMGTKKQVS